MKKNTGLKTVEKEVIVSKKGSKSDTRQTRSAFDRHEKVRAELTTPIGDAVLTFEVCGNLIRDGVAYRTGDAFDSLLNKEIENLIKIGRVKIKK
jgi:hypothetical protein